LTHQVSTEDAYYGAVAFRLCHGSSSGQID